MIDLHCHLDLYPNAKEIAAACKKRGIYVLSVTTTPSAWQGTEALAKDAPRIRTALGLHPQLAHERIGELPLFEKLLPNTRYVGEIGLDGAPEFKAHWDKQITVFDHILLQCSKIGDRILSIHSRKATKAVLDRVEVYHNVGTFILHWFSGSQQELERAIELGCWFSVGPAMLTSAKGRALAQRMPMDRVLTETDGPFAQIAGSSLLPWQANLSYEALSRAWSVDEKAVENQILKNLNQLVSR